MSFTIVNRAATPESRQQLEELNAKTKDLRIRLQAAHEKVSNLRLNAGEGGVSYRDAAEAANERDRLVMEMNDLDAGRQALLGHLSPNGPARGAANDFDPNGVMADQFQDPAFAEMMNRLAGTSTRIPQQEIGQIPREDLVGMTGGALQASTGGIVTPTPGMGGGTYPGPFVPLLQPQNTILGLIPSGTTDAASFPYVQEIPSSGDPGPAPVAPGTTKPAAGIAYQDAVAHVSTIAGWVKLNKQSAQDSAQLQPAIQSRLLFKLLQNVLNQVIAGTGSVSDVTGQPGLTGLLATSNILTVDGAGKPEADAILNGIAACLTLGAAPNLVVLSIADWVKLLQTKTTTGEYIASPFAATVSQIWNTAFLPSVAVAAGTAIVIDTRLACTLLWREGAHVIVGQESDDMVKNKLTLLVEARASLPVWIPAAVCEVTNFGA